MTSLDKQLQEMAAKNWEQFVALIGEKPIRDAKACMLRRGDNSYGEIAQKLKIPRSTASTICASCPDIKTDCT